MKSIHKAYSESFVLEPTKLTSIVETIHKCLGDQLSNGGAMRDHFEVFLTDRREEMSSLEDVFALENSRKRSIKRLLLTSSVMLDGVTRHEVHIDFAPDKQSQNKDKVVAVSIHSDASGWASRTLSEVEQQLERTWQHTRQSLMILAMIAVVVIIFFASNFVQLGSMENADRYMWLKDANLDRIEQILDQGQPLTDEEMKEIYAMQLRNVLHEQRPPRTPQKDVNRKLLIFGIPLIIILGCIWCLFSTYQTRVYLWGDEVARYENKLQMRKVVWGILASILIVGLASKLLVEGLFEWIPKG